MKLKYLGFLILAFANVNAQDSVPKPLNHITLLSVKEQEIVLENDSLLNRFVKIELINKKLFLEKKKTAVIAIVTDTAKIKKTNGVINLPLRKGVKQFMDKDPFDETKQEFTYLGRVNFLKAYVLGGLYWEELDYKFISQKDGREIQSFGSFPYVSPNKKSIISIYDNPYTTEADFQLFSIHRKKPVAIFFASFKNWMPAPGGDMFWSADGCFYLPMLYSNEYWKEDGNYNDNFKYLKITVL